MVPIMGLLRFFPIRPRFFLSAATLLSCAVTPSNPDPVQISLTPHLVFPRGLLGGTTRVSLAVFEGKGDIECEPTTGHLATGQSDVARMASAELSPQGCPPPAIFCGRVELTRSPIPRAFVATAYAGDVEQAVGCTKLIANEDTQPLRITMLRSLPPSVCGDGTIQPTEQCEPTGTDDAVCSARCQSQEILLSAGNSGAGTLSGNPWEKRRPVFVWPSGVGKAGKFLALFDDSSPPNQEITMRVLDDALGPYRDLGSAIATASVYLPNTRGAVFTNPEAGDQLHPAAVTLGSSTFVVFQSNNGTGNGAFDIHLRTLDENLGAQELSNAAIRINGTTTPVNGEPGSQAFPAIAAGTSGKLFIVWQDDAVGKIRGRTWTPGSQAYGPQVDISSGPNDRAASVTAIPTGWVVAWETGSKVKLRWIGADGKPSKEETDVASPKHTTAQYHPSLASLADGRFAVAFAARDLDIPVGVDVYLQRFTANGSPLPQDLEAPVNDTVFYGDQVSPALASMNALGGSYALAWVEDSSGFVRARLAGGNGGYLFNNINGQTTEFPASAEGRRTRGAPALVSGGSGPYLAIGWEDITGDDRHGIYVRRFPLPIGP